MGVVCNSNGDTGEHYFFFFQSCLRRRAPFPQIGADHHQKFIKAVLENAMSLPRAPQVCAEPFVSRRIGTFRCSGVCLLPGGWGRRWEHSLQWDFLTISANNSLFGCMLKLLNVMEVGWLLRSKVSTTCALKEGRNGNWKIGNLKTLFSREILAVQEAAVQFLFHC